ncbi:hypothetical protein JWG39_01375 [Desulforhopalus vacuolatus]|uniref:hypothetical protein n=1 Tax=Desulforhopalus vacuolatus TaxID=40414 RepID=UPI001963E320|nr:hypothetical protein [Desulforhopalus vacuolatus]MBM9518464.1 hypothetical protein [Desulforhopalus vacuolatus]
MSIVMLYITTTKQRVGMGRPRGPSSMYPQLMLQKGEMLWQGLHFSTIVKYLVWQYQPRWSLLCLSVPGRGMIMLEMEMEMEIEMEIRMTLR